MSTKETQLIRTITPEDALIMIKRNQNNSSMIILDIRPHEEFEIEHIPGAQNLDYDGHRFQEKVDVFDRSKLYIIYCKSGVRGGYFLDRMRELGFIEAYNILGGFVGWKIRHFPLVDY
jgi:rhodanese-related sulfurtransferase